MADIQPERLRFTDTYVLWRWGDVGVGVANGDTCLPIQLSGHKEVTFGGRGGTWGTGALAIHGSLVNDGSTGYVVLTDSARTPISMAADGITEVLQNCMYVKPVLTGSGASGLFIYLYSRL